MKPYDRNRDRLELAAHVDELEPLEANPATWTIPEDGWSDGGAPYTEAELEHHRRPSSAREALERAHAAYLEHERRIPVQLELDRPAAA